MRLTRAKELRALLHAHLPEECLAQCLCLGDEFGLGKPGRD